MMEQDPVRRLEIRRLFWRNYRVREILVSGSTYACIKKERGDGKQGKREKKSGKSHRLRKGKAENGASPEKVKAKERAKANERVEPKREVKAKRVKDREKEVKVKAKVDREEARVNQEVEVKNVKVGEAEKNPPNTRRRNQRNTKHKYIIQRYS